jgi:DNA mismatch endonuclease (patch repair protein)
MEREIEAMLNAVGLTNFVRHDRTLPGNPDFAFPSRNLVIFADSCFFHMCPWHVRFPSSNRKYWKDKLRRNHERDREQRKELTHRGWKVIRIWEHELRRPRRLTKKLRAVLGTT